MNVVVVDDSGLIRQIIINNLLKLGIEKREIREAQDGEHALRILSKLKEVDFIISDIVMPKLDGIELIKNIVKNHNFEKTIIVVISSSISEENRRTLDELGVYGYIPKPFDKDKFMEIIEPMLLKIKSGQLETKKRTMEFKDLMEIAGKEIEESRIEDNELVLDYGDCEIRVDASKLIKIARVVNIKKDEIESKEEDINIEEIEGLQAS